MRPLLLLLRRFRFFLLWLWLVDDSLLDLSSVSVWGESGLGPITLPLVSAPVTCSLRLLVGEFSLILICSLTGALLTLSFSGMLPSGFLCTS